MNAKYDRKDIRHHHHLCVVNELNALRVLIQDLEWLVAVRLGHLQRNPELVCSLMKFNHVLVQ